MPFLGFVRKYYCPPRSRYQGGTWIPVQGHFWGMWRNIGFSEKYSPLDAVSQTLHPPPRCMQRLLGLAWSTSQGRRGREHGWRSSRTFVCPKSSLEKSCCVCPSGTAVWPCSLPNWRRSQTPPFSEPTEVSSDHLFLQTVTEKSVPQLIKSWPLIFSNSLPTNILFPVVVLHCYNHVLKRSMKHQNKNVIINPSSSLGWPVTLPFFPSAIFLCFPDSECWIKLALPSLVYFLSTSQYQHLNCSLSTYCAQSPTKSLLASFSPKHPMCQLIDFFPLWPDILPERQPLKSKFSSPMPESVTVEQR